MLQNIFLWHAMWIFAMCTLVFSLLVVGFAIVLRKHLKDILFIILNDGDCQPYFFAIFCGAYLLYFFTESIFFGVIACVSLLVSLKNIKKWPQFAD